jgi:spoIIIJ-associated protein
MIEKRASLEVIAPSVEEAISRGLDELGLTEEAVEVEVLDTGSKGLFGLGFRQARVRLSIKPIPTEQQTGVELRSGLDVDRKSTSEKLPSTMMETEEGTAIPGFISTTEEEYFTPPGLESYGVIKEDDQEMILRIARETVEELLEKMSVRAEVYARMGEPDDVHSRAPLLIDVRGDDLSILIGPKSETLNALQYIAGLIIGKEIGRSVPLVVDVEGFRARRAQQIRYLARRMAEQAVKTGRRQVLEPMSAAERRLVHIELRNHPEVTTESVGEEPRRKVTIVLRNGEHSNV